MKHKLYIIFIIAFILLGALSQTDVKIKKNTDEIEIIKKHLKTGKISIPIKGKIIFGDGDSYIYESDDDVFDIFIEGTNMFRLNRSGAANYVAIVGADFNIPSANSIYLDGGKDTRIHFNSSNSTIEFYIDNELVGHIDKATGFVND